MADFLPDEDAEVGHCTHHLVMSPDNSDVLYQQNHCGVYRSDDGGDNWIDIGSGHLPATFGFPMAVLPSDGQTIFVVPQVSPSYRYIPEGKLRVYRSRDGGRNWQALVNGLPQENAFLSLCREAMATDPLSPGGVYVGTATGTLFHSRDEGDNWQVLSDTLPPIYSLGTAIIAVQPDLPTEE